MNHKKRFFELQAVREALQTLRAEEPRGEAIEETVRAIRIPPARRRAVRSPWIWRTTLVATAGAALAVFFAMRPQQASAAILTQIAEAVKAQRARHERVYRLDSNGNVKLMLETWIEGNKTRIIDFGGVDPGLVRGYDGRMQFTWSPKDGGSIDDVPPESLPVGSVDSYLQIPGMKLTIREQGVEWEGRKADFYTVDLPNVRFELYVDPGTRLPIARIVSYPGEGFVEKNVYDYPADIPDRLFTPAGEPGVEWCDIPSLRREVLKRLAKPGQIQVVDGVEVRLLALLVGKRRVLGLWTGGSPGGTVRTHIVNPAEVNVKELREEELPQSDPNVGVRFSVSRPFERASNLPFAGGKEILVGEIPLGNTGALGSRIAVTVPVFGQDRAKPLGHARFAVTNAIRVANPERVLWRPSGEVRTTQ